MGYAEFRDGNGRSWRVWKTRPQLAEILSILPVDWKDGWLTFECDGERRRLAPIPDGWDHLSIKDLERLCEEARHAPRYSPSQGTPTSRDSSGDNRA